MALVSAAFVAAVVAIVIGRFMVAAILLAGVAIHGLGWLYLYRRRRDSREHAIR